MKSKLFTASLAATFLVAGMFIGARPSAQALSCAPGSYDAGGFCKAEPTGCPYGDSLSKDKCFPPAKVVKHKHISKKPKAFVNKCR